MTQAERVDPVVFRDYAHYHRHLKIQDFKTQAIVPFRPNPVQAKVYNRILAAEREQRPCRLLIYKARREGVSTLVQSVFAHRAFTRKDYTSLTVSHEEASAQKVHAMTERMWKHLPRAIQPPKESGITGKRLVLTNGSRLEVATAGGDGDVGRSGAAAGLHLSEFAHYPNARNTTTSVSSVVPDMPGTLIVVESTPNGRDGIGGEFYGMWNLAVDGEIEYEPLFFAWHDFPVYRREPEPGFSRSLDAEERDLQKRFGLSLEQLAWRRHTIRERFATDPDMFRQEFPADPEEGFLHSGRPFFDPAQLKRFEPVEPVFRGELVLREVKGRKRAEPYEDPRGPWRVYHKPRLAHRYVLAVDPAGVVTAKAESYFVSKREARDYTAMVCVDRHTGEVACVWKNRFDLGLVGLEALRIAKLYNNAIIAVERSGGYGGPVIQKLQDSGWSNFYTYEVLDDQEGVFKSVKRTEIGFNTSPLTRPRILEGLRDVLREHPEWLADADLKREMDSFVYDDAGKMVAGPGRHDDLVLAAAIAYEVVREKPQRVLVREAA